MYQTDRLSEIEQNLKELTKIVSNSALVQNRSVHETAQQRYELELLISAFEGLKTSFNQFFNRLDKRHEEEERLANIKLQGETKRHVNAQLALETAQVTSRALADLFLVLMEGRDKYVTEEFLTEKRNLMIQEIAEAESRALEAEKKRNLENQAEIARVQEMDRARGFK